MNKCVDSQTQELPGWNLKLSPVQKGQKRPKKAADHSRLVGGRVHKQGNLHTKLVLGGFKVSRSPHLPTRILKAYREALTASGHVFSPDGLSTTLLSQGCVLKKSCHGGNGGWNVHIHCKDRAGSEEPPIAQSTCRSASNHVLWMNSSNNAK